MALILSQLLLAALAAPPEAALRGPVSGFVVDSRSQMMRPINGIPGAALLGPPLETPFRLKRAVFSKNGDFALAVADDDGGVLLVRGLRDPQPAATPLSVVMADPPWILLNATDSAAALYWDSTRQLQILSGLPDRPTAGPAIDVSSLRGSVAAMALDAAGRCVLLGMADPAAGGVFAVCAAEPTAPRFLASSPAPSAIACTNGESDAVIADRSLNQVMLLRNWQGSTEPLLIATASQGISTPVGLQLSGDEKQLFVANAGNNSITVLDLTGASPAKTLSMPAPPTRLERLSGKGVFLLNDGAAGPLFLLDETGENGIYFVPID